MTHEHPEAPFSGSPPARTSQATPMVRNNGVFCEEEDTFQSRNDLRAELAKRMLSRTSVMEYDMNAFLRSVLTTMANCRHGGYASSVLSWCSALAYW